MAKQTFDFMKTLVIGASVSAAVLERNPSRRFLRDLGTLGHATSHAHSGTPGARVLSNLKRSMLADRSAVLAIDLMFWDSVFGLADPTESRAFLRGFFNEIRQRELGIVIGNVPAIHPLQVNRIEINEALQEECDRWAHSRLVQLDHLFERGMSDGGLVLDGRFHSIAELLPDGLHPGPVAAELISREMKTAVFGADQGSRDRAASLGG